MDNIKDKKPRRWLKIASYIGLGVLALETALLVGAGVVGCSQKGQSTSATDGARITTPAVKPNPWLVPVEGAVYNGTTWTFADTISPQVGTVYFNFKTANNVDCVSITTDTGSQSSILVYFGTILYDDEGDFNVYTSTHGWNNAGYKSITLTAEPSQDAVFWLKSYATMGSPEQSSSESSAEASSSDASSDSDSAESSDTESVSEVTFNLPSTYDFRRWVANVDPATGCLSLETRWDNGVGFRNFVFPYDWTAGDGKRYNYIYLNVIGLDSGNALIVNGNGDAKLASNVFGENWSKFSMLNAIRFGYDPNYSGEFVDAVNQQVSLNPTYYANVYRNTLVSGTLDGKGVSGYDCRAVVIPAMYRYFEAGHSDAEPFTTPNYANVTTGELLNMDLNAVVVLGDISSSPMSMLTQGFNAIASILAIQILPNVTLGLLLFIPLIVTVILVIVRLLQK